MVSSYRVSGEIARWEGAHGMCGLMGLNVANTLLQKNVHEYWWYNNRENNVDKTITDMFLEEKSMINTEEHRYIVVVYVKAAIVSECVLCQTVFYLHIDLFWLLNISRVQT